MKKEAIPVTIPKGYEFDKFDVKKSEIVLREQAKHERIKTIADVLEDCGLTQESFDQQCAGLESDEIGYRLAKLITKSLNDGWAPNWDNDNEVKYVPWFYMGGSAGFRYHDCGGWFSYSNVGSRLCFKSSDLAEYAGKQFTEVYKQFML